MRERKQDNLTFASEAEVRLFLSERLDRQTGKAEVHFRRFLAGATMDAEPEKSPARLRHWTLGLGLALAASLAAVWAVPMIHPPAREIGHSTATATAAAPVGNASLATFVQQDVQSQTVDHGISMIGHDNKPVRVLLQHDLQRTRWFDHDQKLQREEVVPQDHVVYVELPIY